MFTVNRLSFFGHVRLEDNSILTDTQPPGSCPVSSHELDVGIARWVVEKRNAINCGNDRFRAIGRDSNESLLSALMILYSVHPNSRFTSSWLTNASQFPALISA